MLVGRKTLVNPEGTPGDERLWQGLVETGGWFQYSESSFVARNRSFVCGRIGFSRIGLVGHERVGRLLLSIGASNPAIFLSEITLDVPVAC
jgi:hypothetical protein